VFGCPQIAVSTPAQDEKTGFTILMAFDFADNASLAEPESAALRSGRRK